MTLLEAISPTSRHLLRQREALRARKERKQKSWLEELDQAGLALHSGRTARTGLRALPEKGNACAS